MQCMDMGEDMGVPDDFSEQDLTTGMWWRHLVAVCIPVLSLGPKIDRFYFATQGSRDTTYYKFKKLTGAIAPVTPVLTTALQSILQGK